MIGRQVSPILQMIENKIWKFEFSGGNKPEYTQEGFRAILKIFMSVFMDKVWELQEKEDISIEDRENMAAKAGEDLRKFIKTYTDIDTHKMY